MAKPSSVKAFIGSIEGICLIESVLRRALSQYKSLKDHTDADTMHAFLALSETYLKVSDACDRKLKTDIQAQREFEELKKQIEAGMTPAEVEQTLEAHFVRKGWGSYDFVRSSMFTYLTESGLKAEQANEIIDACVPKGDARSRQLPLAHKLRKAYDRMESDLESGARDLQEALSSGEGPLEGTDGESKGGPQEGPSDEDA